MEEVARTVRMKDGWVELHLGRLQRIVSRKAERGSKETAFEGCIVRTLDQRFPFKEVVLRYRPFLTCQKCP